MRNIILSALVDRYGGQPGNIPLVCSASSRSEAQAWMLREVQHIRQHASAYALEVSKDTLIATLKLRGDIVATGFMTYQSLAQVTLREVVRSQVVAYHGIGAYRAVPNASAAQRMLNGVVGNEICASDRAIGAFGVVCKGYVRRHYSEDCHSTVAKGQRAATKVWVPFTVARSQEEFEAYAKSSVSGRANAYTEAFITPTAVVALWVKEWASDLQKARARVLAKHRGIPLYVISGTHRIDVMRATLEADLII